MTKKRKSTAPNQYTPEQLARVSLGAATNSAAVVLEYGKSFGEPDIQSLVDEISDTIKKVTDGNMRPCEAMLMGQAEALQAIFVNLSRRAVKMEYVDNLEKFMRLAFKAQSQCRATIETLANIKNPPIVYAKQANIAHGNQQVNNGNTMNSPATHAGKNKNVKNELLEAPKDEQWLDRRTQTATSSINQAMAAVD